MEGNGDTHSFPLGEDRERPTGSPKNTNYRFLVSLLFPFTLSSSKDSDLDVGDGDFAEDIDRPREIARAN